MLGRLRITTAESSD